MMMMIIMMITLQESPFWAFSSGIDTKLLTLHTPEELVNESEGERRIAKTVLSD